MNEVINLLLEHRSIRSFKDISLTEEQVEHIVRAAQAASTSSYIQAYSIIGVTDKEKKQRLAEVVGNQPYVAHNGHFFVFCADLYRHRILTEMEGVDAAPALESTEKYMVALIDTAIAAQNAAIAAESLGMGICYIGGIRNNLEEVCNILKTPDGVLPLFGLAVGYPDKITDKKPRLPIDHVYSENEYEQDNQKILNKLEEYNQIVSAYYRERTGGKRTDRWTEQMASMLDKKVRMYMKEFVENKKMNRK